MNKMAGFETFYFFNPNATMAKTPMSLNGSLIITYCDDKYTALGAAKCNIAHNKYTVSFYDLQWNLLGTAETVETDYISTTLYFDLNQNLLGRSKTAHYANGQSSTSYSKGDNEQVLGTSVTKDLKHSFFTEFKWNQKPTQKKSSDNQPKTISNAKNVTLYQPDSEQPELHMEHAKTEVKKHRRCNLL